MTRKDFQLIADAIRDSNIGIKEKREVAYVLAHRLEGTNQNFKYWTFVEVALGEENAHSRTS